MLDRGQFGVFVAGAAASALLSALAYGWFHLRGRRQRRQRRAQQQLDQRALDQGAATRHLQAILDGLPSLVGYWDKYLVNRFANQAYRQWFGLDEHKMAGIHMPDLLGEGLFGRDRAYVEGALRGEPQTFERAIQRPDDDRIRHSLAHYIPDIVGQEVRGFYVLVHDVTELTESRQELAAALRESVALLQTIQMHSIYSVADVSGLIVDVNEAFCSISGFSRQELIGQDHRIVSSGEHPPQFWAHMWNTITLGHAWHGEVCNRAKDGSLYWVDTVIAPFVGPQGQIEKYVSLRTDITAARLATKALAMERERLDNILTATNVGTWEWNVQTGEARFNERWAQIIGYTLDELAPVNILTWIDHCHPDDLQRSNERLSRHFNGDDPYYECEARMRHKDGHWVWALDRGRVLSWDDNNQPLLMSGTHLDITERKLAEERLRATSEAFLERAGRVAGVGGWEVLLPSGEVIMTTQTRLIHELPEDQVLSLEDMLGHYPSPAQPALRAAVRGAIEQGLGWDMELPFVTASGRSIWVRIVGEAEQGPSGRSGPAPRLIGALQDVTAKHAAEAALREAKLAAEAASSAKSEFLANMSHEIRTPMNAVIGLAYLLEETRLTLEQRQFVTKIQAAGRSLLGVINNVLDLSKIEAGELGIEHAPFSLGTLLQDVRELFGEHAGGKAIAFAIHAEPHLPDVLMGDAQRLRQVLINLLGNAFKFTDEGQVALQVSVVDRRGDHIVLRFAVKDTGMGISPETQERLFTPFMQADASTTRRFGGTGLGLSIVRRLVDLMGGTAGVISKEGQGSEFWFSVPLPVAAEGTAVANEALSEGQALRALGPQGASWLHGVRVLVVDDSDINREVAQKILSREGAIVELARDGHEALAKLSEPAAIFDAVLMDVQMPLMDGHEATRRIRHELGLATLPVIALTAGALVSERARAYEAGMSDFVSKPFDPKALVHALRRHVERHSGQALPVLPRLSDPDPSSRWPMVAGIDSASAADKLGGDVRLFAAMLERLLDEFADIGDAGVPADPAQQWSLASRLHKLRGSSGMLGAVAVHGLADQAERHFHQGSVGPELSQTLRQLGTALDELRDASAGLRQAVARTAGGEPDSAPPAPLGEAERAVLMEQLRTNDLAAVTTFQAMGPALLAALGPERFERLRVAVMSLAFDWAQRVLAEA